MFKKTTNQRVVIFVCDPAGGLFRKSDIFPNFLESYGDLICSKLSFVSMLELLVLTNELVDVSKGPLELEIQSTFR